MGVSDSDMFLSEKDTMEFSFLVRPPLEEFHEDGRIAPNFQDEHKEERVVVLQEEEEEESKLLNMKMGPLMELKSPSSGEFKVGDHEYENDDDDDDDDDDGFKTPTRLDHKIPVILKCPPAPRKPKPVPIISQKQKAFRRRRRILLDLTKEIESLFPPALLADLGNKIKKVRQGSDFKIK